MKKVLLLGDSIRMGYDEFVKEYLAHEAEVFFNEDNGRFLQYTLRCLQDWKEQSRIPDDVDVVHWNNGLWDVGHLGIGATHEAEALTATSGITSGGFAYEEDNLTPPDFYRHMLVRVYKRIRLLFPVSKVIFAYTTPIVGDSPPFLFRCNEEVCRYNAIARSTLEPLGVVFNDLYSFADANARELHRDWVHYNDDGSRLLARRVCEAIRANF